VEESRACGANVYRDIVDASPTAVVITDREGRLVLVNAKAEAMYGYAAAALLGARMDDLLLPQRLRERRRVWRERYYSLPEGRPMLLERVETVGLRRDGSEFPAEMNVTPIQVAGESMLLAHIEDVTARRQLEQEAAAVSDDLIATVSHELRTPLTSIIGYTELLADIVAARVTASDLNEELTRMLQIVERNAIRERGMVEALLTMAFLDSEGEDTRVALGPVDLNKLACQVVEDHLPGARSRGVALSVTENDTVGAVAGDRFRLYQVLDNLVSNAVKFTDPGGQVHVSVHDGGKLASVEVTDTGSGIAPADMPRLFDRLYRSPSAIASQKQGAGLGLPIVKRIVDAHDGHISVRSTPAHGTLVQVDLPYAEPSSPSLPRPH
jgi:two-component system, OmpR family, phosphate regulon sensor histidine kinase PhoR